MSSSDSDSDCTYRPCTRNSKYCYYKGKTPKVQCNNCDKRLCPMSGCGDLFGDGLCYHCYQKVNTIKVVKKEFKKKNSLLEEENERLKGKNKTLKKINKQLHTEIEKLKEENEQLRYQPGGSEYKKAKEHFENLINNYNIFP